MIVLEKERKEVGNNMNILTYRCPADIHTYSITCKDEWLDMYMQLLFENDVYKVNLNNLNNHVEFTSYADYEQWKNVKNNMNILTYNLKNDIHTYSINCKDEWLDMYMQLLFENDVYKVNLNNLNNHVEFTSYADYEQWKNVNK